MEPLRSSFRPLIALILAGASLALGQTRDRAELTGRVADETAAVLPGVEITLVNNASGHRHETRSNERGLFTFPYLPPGNYTLTAELTGFARLTMEGIRLAVNQALDLPLVLRVGGPDSRVTVTTAANRIETGNAAVKYRLTERQVADWPALAGSSSFGGRYLLQSVAFLVPGASKGYAGFLNGLSINGSPAGGVGFSIDGIDNSSMGPWAFARYAGGALSPGPNPDAVQELTAVTANFKAEAGNRPVLLNLETKSGGNDLRGQARVLRLDPDLAARDFFDMARKSAKTTTVLGFQLSGPVAIPGLYDGHGKTLFFVDQENTRSRLAPANSPVPTLSDREREGDFSGLPAASWPVDPSTGAVFPGGRIPSARILPQSRTFVDGVIVPPGGKFRPTGDGNTQVTSRIDHQFSRADTLNVSFFWDQGRYAEPSVPNVQDYVMRAPMGGRNLAAHHTRTLSARAANSASFGTSGAWHDVFEDGRFNAVDLAREGFDILRLTDGRTGFPIVWIEGLPTFRPGGSDYSARESSWTARDDFSLSARAHVVKAGAELRWLRGNSYDNSGGAPSFSFTRLNPSGTGNAIADFLLGIPSSYSQSTDATNYPRRTLLSVYLQDDVKLRPNVTLNLGLRYELGGAWSERDGRNAAFRAGARSTVFPLAPAGAIFAGDRDLLTGETLDERLTPLDRDNFAPRVGIAYSPSGAVRLFGGAGRSSIRAGYGIYYVFSRANAVRSMANMPPWRYTVTRDPSQLARSGATFANPWGSEANPFAELVAGRSFPRPLENVPFVEPELAEPYQHQWTLSLARQLRANLTVEATYVGNRALRLVRQFQANPGLLTAGATPFNVGSRRQYPDFGAVPGYASDGVSSHHALQLSAARRFASTLQFNAHYVWSKTLDDSGGAVFAGGPLFGDRDVVARARADFDRRHQFVFLGVWELPRVPAGRIVGAALSGWQVNPVVHLNSGLPLDIRNFYDSTLRGSLAGWPDIVGPFRKLDPREVRTFVLPSGQAVTGNFLFDPTAFRSVVPAGPQEARPGTLGRNAFTGHGIANVDLSLLRRFAITERRRLELRADVANVFNHAQFTVPFPGALTASTFYFGQTLLSTLGPRRVQLLLRYSF